jgi:hypothetical protein
VEIAAGCSWRSAPGPRTAAVTGPRPIFTLRSLDGKPLAQSRRVKIFHASGGAGLPFRGNTRAVAKEAVLALA